MNEAKAYCEKRVENAIDNRFSNEPQPKKLKTDSMITTTEMLNKPLSCERNGWEEIIAADRESKTDFYNQSQR